LANVDFEAQIQRDHNANANLKKTDRLDPTEDGRGATNKRTIMPRTKTPAAEPQIAIVRASVAEHGTALCNVAGDRQFSKDFRHAE
tara:strand:- start:208 stop:465 length:258 start_codon:yes stop_codon:yes gene_type:complete